MKNAFFTAILGSIFAVAMPVPASAFEISIEAFLCPIESLNEIDTEDWSPTLAENNGQLNEAQLDQLTSAVLGCAEKLNWSEDDTASALELSLAILGGTAMSDKLLLNGVSAEYYEIVLDDRTNDELRQILSDPSNSPALDQLAAMMVEELGSTLTDEIAGDLGAYIGFTAQSRYSTLKLMGMAD